MFWQFESNDSTNPDLPLIGVTNQTDTFSGNVTVGEAIYWW